LGLEKMRNSNRVITPSTGRWKRRCWKKKGDEAIKEGAERSIKNMAGGGPTSGTTKQTRMGGALA